MQRRFVLVGALVAVLALVACSPRIGKVAVGERAVPPQVWDTSDPDVLVTGGTTYLFGSTNNMRLPVREITTFSGSISTSQTQWARNPRDAMPTRPSWVDAGEAQIWAPSAVQIGSRYWLYFAAARSGAIDEANDQCIGRASSSTPMGPYAPESAPIYCGLPAERGSNTWGRGALDPEVYKAPDGKLHLLVALSRTTQNIGSVQLDSAGLPRGGRNAAPAILASQSFTWHDGSINSTLDRNAFLENPTMTYDAATKTYLLFYSAGHWFTSRYLTGFGRCATPAGPCSLDSRGPFLQGGNGRSGPGGLTVFTDPQGVKRVAYATWTEGFENQSGSVGQYSRQVSWNRLVTTNTSDPAAQSVYLD